jgi:hypothetical protein
MHDFDPVFSVSGSMRVCVKEDFDLVLTRIGREYRRLLRNLGLPDGLIEQLIADYSSQGIHEVTYQGLLKWSQREGQGATVQILAEALHAMERDDIVLLLR